jgi:hypothetical protein
MVKSTVVVTLSKGKLGSRLGKVNGSNAATERVEKGTGLLSSAMKKAMGVQKAGVQMSKPGKPSPLRSISARLGNVGGLSSKAVKSTVQVTLSEGIFGAERPAFRSAMGGISRPAAGGAASQRSEPDDEGKVCFRARPLV